MFKNEALASRTAASRSLASLRIQSAALHLPGFSSGPGSVRGCVLHVRKGLERPFGSSYVVDWPCEQQNATSIPLHTASGVSACSTRHWKVTLCII